MKIIEVDDELYHYIASKTEKIGEPASDILRRLLGFAPLAQDNVVEQPPEAVVETVQTPVEPQAVQAPVEEPAAAVVKAKKPRRIPERKLSQAQQREADEVAKLEASDQLARLNLDDLSVQQGAVGRFLYILDALAQVHSEAFASVVKIKGRDRLYFSDSEEQLLSSGSSTNPKRIGETTYWVITNNNTSRKKWMLSEVAKMLGYGEADIRILAAKV